MIQTQSQDQTQSNNPILSKEMDNKIRDFKYKLYIFFILLFSYFLYGYLIDSFSQVNTLKQENQSLELKYNKLNGEKETVKKNDETIKFINNNNEKIKSCINNMIGCDDSGIKKYENILPIIKSYLSLNNYSGGKMEFDQKTLLRNINEYLLYDGEKRVLNGILNIVAFGVPVIVDPKMELYKLPLTLNVDFENNESLFSFIKNIEKKVQTDNNVLYKIDAINYDIVNYQSKQVVTISMNMYFYK